MAFFAIRESLDHHQIKTMKFRSNYYTKTHWKKTKFDYKKFHLHHKKYSDSSNLSSNLTHIMGFAGIATDSFVNLQAKGLLASKHRGSKCASIGAGSWLTPIKISLKLKLTHCSFFFYKTENKIHEREIDVALQWVGLDCQLLSRPTRNPNGLPHNSLPTPFHINKRVKSILRRIVFVRNHFWKFIFMLKKGPNDLPHHPVYTTFYENLCVKVISLYHLFMWNIISYTLVYTGLCYIKQKTLSIYLSLLSFIWLRQLLSLFFKHLSSLELLLELFFLTNYIFSNLVR